MRVWYLDQCMQIGKRGMTKIKWILFYTLGITFIIGSNVWLAKRDAQLFDTFDYYDQKTIQTNQDS